MERLAEVRILSRPDQLKSVREVVRATAVNCGCAPDLVDALTLAVDEACANVIRHAYGMADSEELVLQIFAGDNELVFRVRDYAAPVESKRLVPRAPDPLAPGGLGLQLMNTVMDTIELTHPPGEVGNILEMRKTII